MRKRKKFQPPPKKNLKLQNVFASLKSRTVHMPQPVTLPKINGLTLEEIEEKYGKL